MAPDGKPARELFMKMHREFRCTLWCLNRPELLIEVNIGNTSKVIGKIRSPFLLFSLGLEIFD